ncbi:hypothetical protein CFIMG_007809RA00001 [Ceratocystis fimbriata CBS 114723]|uniref:Uncharacterized protein n=1 Tax=Ceratocystis fimbriata CBS 114723 TaxID=1035309 RepID=A0A2C5WU06_9PEZI|nr:hypothetical protein CFIMG_007809RA00001 [Ceratocystis fimbriata CBS 114723]
MAASLSLPELFSSLSSSLHATNAIGPSVSKVEHSNEGISLLDTKNELLLSYLQHLVFLVLAKTRNARRSKEANGESGAFEIGPIVEKLAELRLYIEKGVRPLEDKLRYQIDKVLRAASAAEATSTAINGPKESASAGSGTEDDDESGSDSASDSESDAEEAGSGTDEPNSMLAPRLAAFVRQTRTEQRNARESAAKNTASSAAEEKSEVYKASKTRRVLMPEDDKRPRGDRKKMNRSRTMEEYLEDEFSTAPSALPSIGTTIAERGRKVKTAAERKVEAERREYEETNFTRLPKESKKQRKQRMMTEGRSNKMSFGGEEWRELGDGVDRIERLTKRKGGTGSKALLERSRKRAHDSGGRGAEMGDRFQKRLKVLEGGRRDKGGRR